LVMVGAVLVGTGLLATAVLRGRPRHEGDR